MTRLTPTVKAFRLAIADLKRVCHENYTYSALAARYGFQFGINAKKHYDAHQEAITIFQKMLDKLKDE